MATDSTSSRCVTASHSLEVTNFPMLDGMGIGKFISSSTFSVGGCDWRIDFYPNGDDPEKKGVYVSAFLYFVKGTAGVNAMAIFSLLDNNSDQQAREPLTTPQKTFQSVGTNWGFSNLLAKSSLLDFLSGLDNGGCLTVRCVVTVQQAVLMPHAEEDADAVVLVPQPKLHQDLTDMLKSGEGADVTFSVGGQLFPAHRCILAARSKVFKAELFGAMKEKDARRIKIKDMEPTTFEALLHFIYADSLAAVDDADNNVAMQHLLVAADRYGLDRLRLLCEAKLCHDIDAETVATTLALAEQHHCTQLRGACIGYIASSDVLGAFVKTDGFKHLIASCPSIMEEILDKVATVWSNK